MQLCSATIVDEIDYKGLCCDSWIIQEFGRSGRLSSPQLYLVHFRTFAADDGCFSRRLFCWTYAWSQPGKFIMYLNRHDVAPSAFTISRTHAPHFLNPGWFLSTRTGALRQSRLITNTETRTIGFRMWVQERRTRELTNPVSEGEILYELGGPRHVAFVHVRAHCCSRSLSGVTTWGHLIQTTRTSHFM